LAKLSEPAVSYVGGEKHEKLKTTRKRRRSDEHDDDDDAERKARQAGMGRGAAKEGRKTNSAQNDRKGRQFHAKLYQRRVRNWRSRKQEKKYRPFGQAGSSGHPAGPYLGLRVSIPLSFQNWFGSREKNNFNFNFKNTQ
jgi:hypothetical protein